VAELRAPVAEKLEITLAVLIERADQIYRQAMLAGQFNGRISALKELGVLSGKRVERSERGEPGEFDRISDEELREAVTKIAMELGFTPPEECLVFASGRPALCRSPHSLKRGVLRVDEGGEGGSDVRSFWFVVVCVWCLQLARSCRSANRYDPERHACRSRPWPERSRLVAASCRRDHRHRLGGLPACAFRTSPTWTEDRLNKFVYDPNRSGGKAVLDATKGSFRFSTGCAGPATANMRSRLRMGRSAFAVKPLVVRL
jgi:hypothetical protein